jgi:predicted MFS family arabinose efflux permease
MIIEWIALSVGICLIAISYFKGYKLKTRVVPIVVIMIISLLLLLPIFPFSRFTLWGLFFIERIWILLALVLMVEVLTSRKNRIRKVIFAGISIAIYLFLRRFI